MATPLHLSISEQLRHQIVHGDYQPGEQLPSEYQLVEELGVSRTTIRRAIANLAHQGLVTSHQGKGVFVTERQKVAYSLSSPMIFLQEDMIRQGIQFTTRNLSCELVSVTEEIQDILKLPDDNSIAYVQKNLLEMNGIPGGLDITYILPHLGQAYADDLRQYMTFPTLEKHGIVIQRVEAILECTHADHEISQYLDVSLGYPLIVYRHTAYTATNQVVAYGETISRADRFCYSITIHRRMS